MRKVLIIVIAASVLLLGFGAFLRPRKSADPDGTMLRYAVKRATHPTRQLVHSGQLLGIIQVPRLGLAVPVLEGADEKPLESGAGHIPHTAFPGHHGNAGIAAHRDTCFRALRFIKPHDDIVITTPDGAYNYVVSGTEIVSPSDGQVLHRTSDRTLTLVTCYPFFYVGDAPKRFIVHAQG